jgi:hypothetical protein
LSSLTVKLAVFSLWNGQQPLASPPLRVSLTVFPISADSVVRERSWSSHSTDSVMGFAPWYFGANRSVGEFQQDVGVTGLVERAPAGQRFGRATRRRPFE